MLIRSFLLPLNLEENVSINLFSFNCDHPFRLDMTILDVMMNFYILLIFLPTSHLFPLVQYHGDRSAQKSYYTTLNSTASLIDYMRTLYEQDQTQDYNLIRALAPRLGKISPNRLITMK